MAKKKSAKKQSEKVIMPKYEDQLPQNIIAIGEHVEENKNIYISQSAYKEIHRFTKDKTTNESGGVLLGRIIENFGKINIVIYAFVEAKFCEGTPTTLKFTHETWKYVHRVADKKYPDLKILGWIHTHPNFGIFLSEYDKFIQQNFFSEENQIAYVVDPIQKIEGFYFWINQKIERCKGFYIFDRTGVKITVSGDKEEKEKNAEGSQNISMGIKVIIGILSIMVILLSLFSIKMNKKINNLESSQNELFSIAFQNFSNIDQAFKGIYDQPSDDNTSEESTKSNQNKHKNKNDNAGDTDDSNSNNTRSSRDNSGNNE